MKIIKSQRKSLLSTLSIHDFYTIENISNKHLKFSELIIERQNLQMLQEDCLFFIMKLSAFLLLKVYDHESPFSYLSKYSKKH